jgi:hypothetical protein
MRECKHLRIEQLGLTVEELASVHMSTLRFTIAHLRCVDCGCHFGKILKQERVI